MKNFTLSFRKKQLVSSALCAFFWGACLTTGQTCHAQTSPADTICFTYSQHIQNVEESSGTGFRVGGKFAPCIMLKPEQGLSGCQIAVVNPCLTYADKTTKRPGKIFIKDPVTLQSLYEQDCELQFGYNPIELTTPYTIGTTNVLIGYEVNVEPGEYILGIGTHKLREEEGCWLIYQNKLQNCAGYSSMSNWAMEVAVLPNGQDKSTNLIVRSLTPELPYVAREKNAKAYAIVHNLSTKDITSVTCKIDGITASAVTKQLTLNIKKGHMDTLKLDAPIIKSGKLEVSLSKVNDIDKEVATSSTCSFVYYGKQNMPKRQHLFERWVAQWAPFTSRVNEEIDDVKEFFEGTDLKFNICELHVDDNLSTAESEILRANSYNNMSAGKTPVPRLSLNRIPYDDATVTYSCLGNSKARLEDLEEGTYSFYNFNLSLTPTDDPKKLKAKVDVTELEKLDFDDVVLTLTLLEDSVLAVKQTQAPSDPYYYNNLFVKTINSTHGTPLVFVDGKFSETYDVEIGDIRSGNINNFKVLATIGRRPNVTSPASDKMIFDSRVATYPVASGITQAEAPAAVNITVADGKVCVTGAHDHLSIYTATGQIVDPALPLSRGNYIVKVTRGKNVITRKINVK